jgi:hypothetical protein
MNCAECRENLVAHAERLLEREESLRCEAHLESCADCRNEYAAVSGLQERLIARGQAAAEVSIAPAVMRRVLRESEQPERETIMSKLFTGWGLGLSAAAAAAVVALVVLLASPGAKVSAAEVMARGAKAVAGLGSIHIQGKLRTLPHDNFSHIDPTQPFHDIQLWKQFVPELKWRIEKPGRVALMDGQSTLLFIKPPGNTAMKIPQASPSAFDTDWLHRIANLSATIEAELSNAAQLGWPLSLAEKRAADGRTKAIVTIEARSGLPENDYLKNKLFDTADSRRVYSFDTATELLEAVQIYLSTPAGEVLVFEITRIDYNQPIDPTVFQLELPANVAWYKDELAPLPDNAKYASMTAEQAARVYWEAFAREDWIEAERFRKHPLAEKIKQLAGGLELISLGEAFASEAYDPDGRFVPYEIRLRGGDVLKHNIALKKDRKTGRWFVDGGAF